MFFLQVDFQELERIEAILPDLITVFETTREHCWPIPSVVFNVMVVANMLTKVILTLETVVASISMTVSGPATLDIRMCWNIILHNEK
jgi:uncharacterized protein YejL (UPF0352 family)